MQINERKQEIVGRLRAAQSSAAVVRPSQIAVSQYVSAPVSSGIILRYLVPAAGIVSNLRNEIETMLVKKATLSLICKAGRRQTSVEIDVQAGVNTFPDTWPVDAGDKIDVKVSKLDLGGKDKPEGEAIAGLWISFLFQVGAPEVVQADEPKSEVVEEPAQ
jgi:hypothetical protein